jgi:SAM-dependent methyltransferase
MTTSRDPDAEIAAGNPWYVESQVDIQLGSPAFRAVVENRWRVFTAAIDRWVTAREGETPNRVLDAGCGDGINLSFLTAWAAERRWTTAFVGADYNPLRIGRARTAGAARFLRTSVTALAFADCSFDVVLCNQVLEHVPEVGLAFHELRRVLRPGGLLLVGVPNEGSLPGRLRNHLLQRSILRTTDHVNMFTRRALFERLADADLQVERFEPEALFVPHTAVHGWLNSKPPVKRVLDGLGRRLPSCAAGLLVAATRPL